MRVLGLCQCFWELAGSVVFYNVYNWMDYDLVDVGVFQGVWRGGGKLVFGV